MWLRLALLIGIVYFHATLAKFTVFPMKQIRTLLLLAAFIGVLPQANAQYVYNGPGSRGPASLEIGYSYLIAGATYKTSTSYFDEKTFQQIDTSSSEHINSKGGFGAMIGYSWPVARAGNNGRLAISFAYLYDAILWESGGFSYSSNSQTGTESVGSGTIEMGGAIGLDYKTGCDAWRDKSQKFCWTFGLGAYPSYRLTVFKDMAMGHATVLPYVKAEVGIFAGICMKIRAQVSFGKIKYIDYSEDYSNGSSSTSLIGKTTTSLSLVLMPFSWKWGRSQWWGGRR